jgi:putative acetyltransferase
VAEVDGAVIGHVAVSPVAISDGSLNWYGLGPISVSPEHQGYGIGSSLIRESLQLLKEMVSAGCVVLGDPRYYSRFGFKPESNIVYPSFPQEYFQTLSFGTVLPCGVVTYSNLRSNSPQRI